MKNVEYNGFIENRKCLCDSLLSETPDFYLFILSFFVFMFASEKHTMWATAAANKTRSICLSSVVPEA